MKPNSDFYNELGQIIEDALIAVEVEPETAASVTASIIAYVARTYGGSVIYLKNGLSGEIAMKHEQIAREFNGRNLRQLSMKYKMSAVWIKKIVKRHSR